MLDLKYGYEFCRVYGDMPLRIKYTQPTQEVMLRPDSDRCSD